MYIVYIIYRMYDIYIYIIYMYVFISIIYRSMYLSLYLTTDLVQPLSVATQASCHPIFLRLLGSTIRLAPGISRLGTWLKMGQEDPLSHELKFFTEIYRDWKWIEVIWQQSPEERGTFALISKATLIPILPKVWLTLFIIWQVILVSSQ